MSAPVSAYAAYKVNNMNVAKGAVTRKHGATDSKSLMTAKKFKTNAQVASPSAKTASNSRSMNKRKDSSDETKTKKIKGAATLEDQKPKGSGRQRTDSAGFSAAITNETLDQLIEQLMNKDPKQLTKENQKKRKELEEYIIKNLQHDEASFIGDSSDSDHSNFAEYTLNSYNVDSANEEYDEGEHSGSTPENKESCSGVEMGSESVSSISESEYSKKSKASYQKRKSDDVVIEPKSNLSTKTEIATLKDYKKQKIEEVKGQINSIASQTGRKSESRNKQANAVRSKICENIEPKTTIQNIKSEPLSPPSSIIQMNSIYEGKRTFNWLLNPATAETFFKKHWEKSACLIKRQQANYFSHLISFAAIDEMLIRHHLEFTKNIDVTSYKNGVRETLNPEGRAMPPVVWEHYGQGCSIRLLNPQTFLADLFKLNTTLQEYFHCLIGANAYLTPPNSQGFAPHYDDIEAFVLQIEGRKRWKLYQPIGPSAILPRESSQNFTQAEIGKPILEEVLSPGDILYFPRGTIHQACTEPGYHSLHITLSVYQKQAYADFFEQLMPIILQRAITENLDIRRGLPLDIWHHMGIVNSDVTTKERRDFQKNIKQLVTKSLMPTSADIDGAVDQLAKKYQREALPPNILSTERLRTVFGSRNRTNELGECVCDYDITLRTNVRLLRANILRLIEENGKICIYYYLHNSREYCEYEPNFIEIERSEAASVQLLVRSYPAYVSVSQLPLADDESKINVVSALWELGLIMMEKPFN